MAEFIRQEVERRCGPDATFEEEMDVAAAVGAEALRHFVATGDNDEGADGRSVSEPSSD